MVIAERNLSKRGEQTQGEIESIYVRETYSSTRGRMVEDNWMIVGYWVDGVWHGNRFKLSAKVADTLEKGQQVTVYYDPSDPGKGRPDFISAQARNGRIKAIVGYLLVFGAVQSFVMLYWKPHPVLRIGARGASP